MAAWQYKQRAVNAWQPTDRGYFVNLPRHKHISDPSEGRYTVALRDAYGNLLKLWVHQITMSAQIAGSTAQSNKFRAWYPRNYQAPRLELVGQVQNQHQYGEIAEWVRGAQRAALRTLVSQTPGQTSNLIKLYIPEGGILHFHHGQHLFGGHIPSIERRTERYVNSPEFRFEFIVATADAGIFSIDTASKSHGGNRMAQYMQMTDSVRRRPAANGKWITTGNVDYAPDPDTFGPRNENADSYLDKVKANPNQAANENTGAMPRNKV